METIGKWLASSKAPTAGSGPPANSIASPKTTGCAACVEANDVSGCRCWEQADGKGDQKYLAVSTPPEEHTVKPCSSFLHSVVNMVGMLIGLGQLSTPYALENGGWATAFLLVGLGAACAYTTHIIGKCLQENLKSKDYPDIGEQAFGRAGRVLAATFIYLEIFLALVSYTISLHDNLALVFAGAHVQLPWLKATTPQLLTLAAVLVALPSLWLRDLSSISFLSFGGIAMSGVILGSLGCTALFGGVTPNKAVPALNARKIPAISGLYIFSYAGHIVFPNIYKAMKDPSRFTQVSITSFSVVTILYAAMAFLGAKLFGPAVNPQVTLSMPAHQVATKIALWAVVLTPMTKYALEFAPFAMQLEHALPASMSSRARMAVRGSVGSVLLLVILALALAIPYFEHVLGLTGSLVSTCICLVFPCVFYIKICGRRMSRPAYALNAALAGLGALLGLAGTISSSRSLFRSIIAAH